MFKIVEEEGPRTVEDYAEKVRRKREEKRIEKKKRTKAMFDNEYDEKEGGGSYYDEWKAETEQQAQVSYCHFLLMKTENILLVYN